MDQGPESRPGLAGGARLLGGTSGLLTPSVCFLHGCPAETPQCLESQTLLSVKSPESPTSSVENGNDSFASVYTPVLTVK